MASRLFLPVQYKIRIYIFLRNNNNFSKTVGKKPEARTDEINPNFLKTYE